MNLSRALRSGDPAAEAEPAAPPEGDTSNPPAPLGECPTAPAPGDPSPGLPSTRGAGAAIASRPRGLAFAFAFAFASPPERSALGPGRPGAPPPPRRDAQGGHLSKGSVAGG